MFRALNQAPSATQRHGSRYSKCGECDSSAHNADVDFIVWSAQDMLRLLAVPGGVEDITPDLANAYALHFQALQHNA